MRVQGIVLAGALAALAACSRASAPAPGPTTATPPSTPPSATPSGDEAAAEPFTRLSIDELAGLLTAHGAVAVYDTNSRARYEQGHVPGARWVEHDGVTAAVLPQDQSTRLVFYCANEH
jgi:hypothetical protein